MACTQHHAKLSKSIPGELIHLLGNGALKHVLQPFPGLSGDRTATTNIVTGLASVDDGPAMEHRAAVLSLLMPGCHSWYRSRTCSCTCSKSRRCPNISILGGCVGRGAINQLLLCNKTAKICLISSVSALQCIQFWKDSFPIWHKWSLAQEGVTIGQR